MKSTKLSKVMKNKFEVIADLGALDASKHLSIMTKKKVNVSIPWVSSYPYEKIVSTAGRPQEMVTAVFMQMKGDVNGFILMVFPEKDAIEMANLLEGRTEAREELGEDGESALKEAAGNILANAYLNAFAMNLNIRVTDSVPSIVTDMLGSVLDGILGNYAAKSYETIIFKNRFKIGKRNVQGNAYIFVDPESFDVLFEKLLKWKGK